MYDQVYKRIDDALWKDSGCGSELDKWIGDRPPLMSEVSLRLASFALHLFLGGLSVAGL